MTRWKNWARLGEHLRTGLPAVLTIVCLLLGAGSAEAQVFSSCQALDVLPLAPAEEDTQLNHKPQSKTWTHDGHWWAVMPQADGSYLYKLNRATLAWEQQLPRLSASTNLRADVVQDPIETAVTHVLLFVDATPSASLVSLEYVTATDTYRPWPGRDVDLNPNTYDATAISLAGTDAANASGVEVATVAIDSTGRMWVAYDNATQINVRHSVAPYTTFSTPINMVTGITADDISDITALPNGTVGVFWSNQTTRRFGFRVHSDNLAPETWGADEVPAAAAAQDTVGVGMADDHVHLTVGSDSTVYAVVKTGYNIQTAAAPDIGLLVRRSNGIWDSVMRTVDPVGTRGIGVLNENEGTFTVMYQGSTNPVTMIAMSQAPLATLVFPARSAFHVGPHNNPTTTRQIITNEVVVIGNAGENALEEIPTESWGVLCSAPNDPPTATNDSYTATGITPLNVAAPGVLGNDDDPNDDDLTAVLVSGPAPAGGTLLLNPDGSFSYTHHEAPAVPTVVTFTYRASDGVATSNVATVSITVNPGPLAPVADNDSYSANGTATLSVPAPGVLDGDTDANSDPLTAVLVTGPSPAGGTLVLNANGSFTYTHPTNPAAPETVTFTYQASDGTLLSNTATVTITVNPVVPVAPVADNDSYTATGTTPLTVTAALGVLNGDTDANGDPLTAVLDGGPVGGTLTLNANGSFTYTHGTDPVSTQTVTFTYHASDGALSSNVATVTITVNSSNVAPVADNDAYAAAGTTPLVVTAALGVLNGDTDANGNPLTAVLVAGATPAGGTLVLNPDGSFSYTHNVNPAAPVTVTFTYQASDGSLSSNVATVTITVNPGNVAPVADNDAYTASGTTTLNVTAALGVLNGDTDANGNPLTAVLVTGPAPAGGLLVLNANGSFTYTHNVNPVAPVAVTFTYQANDGTLNSNVATVTITVNPVVGCTAPNAPTNLTASVSGSTATVNWLAPVGGTAPTGYRFVGGNAPGATTQVLNTGSTATTLTITIPAGTWYFRLHALACTPTLVSGPSNELQIPPPPANVAPVADNDAYTATGTTPLNVTAALGVLNGDTDANSNPLTAVLVSPPVGGTLALNANGSFTYTHGTNPAAPTPVTFTYQASDGTLLSNIATVTITVNPAAANVAPVADNDAYTASGTTTLNVTAALGVLNGDTDANGNPLTAVLVSPPVGGTLALNANGSFTYTHGTNPVAPVTVTFTYTANDGTLNSNVATVTITVNPAPPACTAPNAPTNLTVTFTALTVTATWTAPASGPAPTGYRFTGGNTPGATAFTLNTGNTATSLTVPRPAGTWYFRVHALNGCASPALVSPASNQAQVP